MMSKLRSSIKKVWSGNTGHTWEKLHDTIYGYMDGRLNKKSEYFSNDYVFVDDDFDSGLDVGIDKERYRLDNEFNSNEYRDVNFKEDDQYNEDFFDEEF